MVRQIDVSEVCKMNLLEALDACGGYYKCPRDSDGERIGPLVGYAGKDPVTNKNYVGNVYANFAMMEEWPTVLDHFAKVLYGELRKELPSTYVAVNTFCGAPMGGITLAKSLASVYGDRFIYPEKKVTRAEEEGKREESVLVWDRHQPKKDDVVALVEDVTNNFSTTGKMIDLVEQRGAKVGIILSLLNRSPEGISSFPWGKEYYPVVSVLKKPIWEYKQEDPEVAAEITAGNIVWKPKSDEGWARLMAAVQASKNS